MASTVNEIIEAGGILKGAVETFEADLRASLKQELLALAEERIDALVDETIKNLETRVNAIRDFYADRVIMQFTVKRSE